MISSEEETADFGHAYKFEPNFEGPTKKRSCTDVLCLILFLFMLGGWGVVAYFGIVKSDGDFTKLLYPTDSKGQICGTGEFQNQPYLLFFDLTKCLNPAVLSLGCPTPQVCVKECPQNTITFYHQNSRKAEIRQYCEKISDRKFQSMSIDDLINHGHCPSWVLESKPVLGRCLPSLSFNEGDSKEVIIDSKDTPNQEQIEKGTVKHAIWALGAFLNVHDFADRFFRDFVETWWMIGLGLILASALSLLWIVLMRWIACVMVWTSIGLIFILVGGLLGFSLYKFILVKDIEESQINIFQVNFTPDYFKDVFNLKDTWLAFAVIFGIIFLIILLIFIALRKRIQIAIKVLEHGAKAVAQTCSSVFWPLVPFVLHGLVVAFFILISMYLASARDSVYSINYDQESLGGRLIAPPNSCFDNGNCFNPQTQDFFMQNDTCDPLTFNQTCVNCPQLSCQFIKYKKIGDWRTNWMPWFNLFAFLWSMEFVTAVSQLVLANVFAKWYWSKDDQVQCCALASSLCRVLTFHLGTAAFGSLIIGIIRFVRAILDFIESKLKRYNNDLTKCLLCCCKCCLWCLEKFMRFVNRNAYIMCAMKSTNFCKSARKAFNLLMRNMVRVVVLDGVVTFLLFVGKLVITVGIGTLSYFVFSGYIPEVQREIPTLNSVITPVIITVVGTYLIASSFFSVYEMAVDTTFLCFLEDLERNDGSPERPYFMPQGLLRVLGKKHKIGREQLSQVQIPLRQM